MHSAVDTIEMESVAAGANSRVELDLKRDTAEGVVAIDSSGMVLPLVAGLLPSPSGLPAAKPASRSVDAAAARRDERGVTKLGTTAAEQTAMADTSATRTPEPARKHAVPDAAGGTGNTNVASENAGYAAVAAAHDRNGSAAHATAQAPVQFTPAAPPTIQAAAPQTPQLHINAALNSAAWGGELGQTVVLMIGEKQHVAELHLNPPDLGPLDIRLTVNEHQTSAVFTSPHSVVREAVESALPRLREVLADSGIMLGNASVTSDSARDGGAFATPDRQHRHGTAYPGNQNAVSGAQLSAGDRLQRRGLVDLFA
jgi:flagellar hook-length control protein FliK